MFIWVVGDSFVKEHHLNASSTESGSVVQLVRSLCNGLLAIASNSLKRRTGNGRQRLGLL